MNAREFAANTLAIPFLVIGAVATAVASLCVLGIAYTCRITLGLPASTTEDDGEPEDD